MTDRRYNKAKPLDKSQWEQPFPVVESSSGSQRRSDSPKTLMDVDFDSIFEELPCEWSIEPKTHLPLHRKSKCQDCVAFSRHVVENMKGSRYTHFVSIQWEHWKGELRNEFKRAFNSGWKESQQKIDDLYNQIDKLQAHCKELKESNA